MDIRIKSFTDNSIFNKKNIVLKPLHLNYFPQVIINDTFKVVNNSPKGIPNAGITLLNPAVFNNSLAGNIIESGVSSKTAEALNSVPGKHWAGKLPSNGNREVAIMMPQNFDKNKPAEIIFYFHGHNGQISKSLTDSNYGFKEQINELSGKKNIIVVIPQGPPKEANNKWMNVSYDESLVKLQQEALSIINAKLNPGIKVASVNLKGHSGGGLPIMNGAKEGGLRADRIDFFDASYGSWATSTYQHLKAKNPALQMNIFYIPGTPTQSNALALSGKAGVNLVKSGVNHSMVPKAFFNY